jgi:pilus assembly protein FimV
MIITCGNCETSFNLNEKLLKPTGSKVRCSRCKHMFTAYPPDLPELEQVVTETAAPEEIEEKTEAVEAPEPEFTPEETGDVAAEAVEEADAEESAGDETESAVEEEIDTSLDDLDLEFDIDTVFEENEVVAEAAADDVDGVEETFSGELDADFPDEVTDEAQASAEVEDVMEETDLSGIEESLDMEPAAEETPTEGDTIEDLDLDLDLDFDEVPEEAAPVEEDDLLEDLDLDLGLDVTPEEEISAEEDTTPEELDHSDIELSMESDPEVETDEDELNLDLDLDSDLETDSGLTEDKDDIDSEELDFSEFEETVILDELPKLETEDASDDLGEELDLDLEMADDSLPDAESELPSTGKEDAELEDLDFELDMEFEGEAAGDTADEDGEDVDLSDIEKMLEGDGREAETVSLAPDLDNVEIEVEKWKESPDTDDLMDQTGEIDLSDIMIDADDDYMEEDIEDVELELDIGEASDLVMAAGDSGKPEKIDISGFEEFDIPVEGDQVQGHFSGEDIELEFEVDGDTDDLDGMATISEAEEIEVGSETIEYAEPLVSVDETPTKKKEKKKKTKKIKPVRKSGILRPVMLLLLLLLLPLVAVVLLDRFMDMNVPYVTDYLKQVPYFNQVMKPEMKEVGEIRVDNISSKFIDNKTLGKLFIITGTVKNEFSESRKYIKIQGSLFSAGKTLVKEVTVYGGNVVSDPNLSEMSLTDINQRLSNRFGDNKSNFDVKPGRAIPFMVVFSDLPESLEEFTIEAAGSFPVTKQQ